MNEATDFIDLGVASEQTMGTHMQPVIEDTIGDCAPDFWRQTDQCEG